MSVLSPAVDHLPAKPRMRGRLHYWAFVASFVTGPTLVALAALQGTKAALGTAIYALTVSGLFGISALYHRRTWAERGHSVMKRLDHSMIFLFIAGTYTPFAMLALPQRAGTIVLSVVWGGALAGILIKQAIPLMGMKAPRWITIPPYIALGWVAIFVLPELLMHAGVASLVLLLAGGVFYSLGAIVYAAKWPEPAPMVFGHHEVFHLCTIVAAILHYVAVWLTVY